MSHPKIIVVDEKDNVTGAMQRKDAIAQGLIHRVARIFVFNPRGELFITKRSANVSFPGLWDQSVGGHVDEGETYEEAAHRESKEEIGIANLALTEVATYYNEVKDGNDNLLRRFNRLYSAVTDQEPKCDLDEVAEGRWVSMKELDAWVVRRPEDFTGTDGGFLGALKVYKEHTSG